MYAEIPLRLVVDGGIHCTAVGVAQHHHQPAAQVPGRVLDAAQLLVVNHIARQPDDEQLPPMPAEKMLSGMTRESEQVTMMA